jgi:hypothetical protein
MPRMLTAMLLSLVVCGQLAVHTAATPFGQSPASPAGLLAVAAMVLTGLALAFLAHAPRISAVAAGPLTGRATALRAKARSAPAQRELDPDAPGHARPRAPAAVPAAA